MNLVLHFVLVVPFLSFVRTAKENYLGETYDLDSATMAYLFNFAFRDGVYNPNTNQECLKEHESSNLRLRAQARVWAQDCQYALHDDQISSPTPCVEDYIGEMVHFSQYHSDEIETIFEFVHMENEAYDVVDDLCLKEDNISAVICNSARQAYWHKADQVECATAYCAAADGLDEGLTGKNGIYITSCAFSYKADFSREPFEWGAPKCGKCAKTSPQCDADFNTCCTADKKLNTCDKEEDKPCEDTVAHCEQYKDYGFCEVVPDLFNGCRKTCDMCFTPSPPHDGECADHHSVCAELSANCTKFSWMQHACPKTCGECDPDCSDMYPECEKYLKYNMCPTLRDNKYKCARSCGLCGPMKIEFAKCKDRHPICDKILSHCHYPVIQEICKVSCKTCIPGPKDLIPGPYDIPLKKDNMSAEKSSEDDSASAEKDTIKHDL